MGATTSKAAPLVSWVICTNVADEYCITALNSCLAQTLDDLEVILVANGPKCREIAEYIREHFQLEQRLTILCTDICHLPFCLTLGVHVARGEFIARMDADDIALPHRLAAQIDYLKKHPAVSVVGSNYYEVDHSGRRGDLVCLPESDWSIRRMLPWRNPLCHPSLTIRKDLIQASGGYLGGLNAEDYDLWCRLSLKSSVQFSNLQEPLIWYRKNPGGAARRSRDAYATVASTQMRMLVQTRRPVWLLGILWTCIKVLLRANKA